MFLLFLHNLFQYINLKLDINNHTFLDSYKTKKKYFYQLFIIEFIAIIKEKILLQYLNYLQISIFCAILASNKAILIISLSNESIFTIISLIRAQCLYIYLNMINTSKQSNFDVISVRNWSILWQTSIYPISRKVL